MTNGDGGGTLQTSTNQLNSKNTAFFDNNNYLSSNQSSISDENGNHYCIGVFKVTGIVGP